MNIASVGDSGFIPKSSSHIARASIWTNVLGETIGNFKIVKKLGRGGMGEVWLGEQQSLGTRVAIKTLLEAFPPESEDVQRFFNEARAVSRIQHAGITKIFDSGILPNGRAYLVMEFLDGESLATRIQRGAVSRTALADIGRQIASVLDATHGAGITHRDLKPENVFLIPDREQPRGERVKVLDFGVAKLTGTLAPGSPRTYGTLGTPMYMAPEQWGDASQVDWRADLYSLGCLTFEMACGRPPFPVKSVAEACAKHLNDTPVLASTLGRGIPPALDRLIAQLLEKRAEDRPRSMREVERAFESIGRTIGVDGTAETLPIGSMPPNSDVLATVTAGQASAHAPVTQPVRRSIGWIAGISMALATAAGAFGIYVSTRRTPAPAAPPQRPVVSAIVDDAAVAATHDETVAALTRAAAGGSDSAGSDRGAAPKAVPAPPRPATTRPGNATTHGATTPAHDTTRPGNATTHAATKPAHDTTTAGHETTPNVGGAPSTAPDPNLPANTDQEAVKRGLLSVENALDHCMVVNNITTRQILAISIDPSGRVTSAGAQGALAGTDYSACVLSVMHSVQFPASKSGLKVTVPVTPPS